MLQVEWFCSVHSGSGGKGSSLLPAFLSGSIAATASFIANICFNLAPCPDVTVALDREVLEGGELQQPCLFDRLPSSSTSCC